MNQLASTPENSRQRPGHQYSEGARGARVRESAKRESRARQSSEKPLWEVTKDQGAEYWLEVDVVGQGDEVAHVSQNGELYLAHERTPGEVRVKIVEGADVSQEAKAIQQMDRLDRQFDVLVDTLLKTAGEESDFSREDLLGMKEVLLVEAVLDEDPSKMLVSTLRAVTRSDQRESQQSLIQIQAELRLVEEELAQADPQMKERLFKRVHALQRQSYALRRDINPNQTKQELQKVLDDTGEYLEPVNWRPRVEPSVEEIRQRLDQLNTQMDAVHTGGKFRPLDEMKWYALGRERDEYRFILKAAEFRSEHPTLFESDLVSGNEELPWDQKLFSVGKALGKAGSGARETSVFRLLRDVYLDSARQEKSVRILDSILRSSTAPESLKEAAQAIKEDVREGKLPAPEFLLKQRKEALEQKKEEKQKRTEESKQKKEAEKPTPLERAFDFVASAEQRIQVMTEELGCSQEDLLKIRDTMKTVDYYMRQNTGESLPVGWADFVNAPDVAQTKPAKGFFGRTVQKVRNYFSPRSKMTRTIKRTFRTLPSSTKDIIRFALKQKQANFFNL
ncbi:hypothetical protein HQ487_02050 [Candidatus Uhrbacteria bacterium]|nr:hypothetical protein [Candidatus Uhrbacteria bacterium]